ncbi:AsmA-like C-terminal region-containing protein [Neolewinella lacunae]|uniref:AsmA-like C-terminal domain-containing protein n=1 Tax=Neolewinella lacunae TaxID=1517758 RepID=A0A923T872_9BACT|nr:AsmA-like C-terminal region-containing protein [Neolewinella lacunae]MBC6994271.1 hypothetical protein [Neolewinella lacunae]MDN3635351.1 AsmA-like C-terminal region-containing protein [Neolewinella lacunae]
MLRKVLRWFIVLSGLLILALIGLGIALDRYLHSQEEKLLHEYFPTAGLEVSVQRVDLTIWRNFPRITLALDSLTIRDSTSVDSMPPLAWVKELRAEISLRRILRDTLDFRQLAITDAQLHLQSDTAGRFNAGFLLQDTSKTKQKSGGFMVNWDALEVGMTRVGLHYENPPQRKLMVGRIVHLQSTVQRCGPGTAEFAAETTLSIGGIAFNTDAGKYLADTDLSGRIHASVNPLEWVISPTQLTIGEQEFTVAANFRRTAGDTSVIHLANARTDYELTRQLLHDSLQIKLDKYRVFGEFPVAARIATNLQPGGTPEISVDFALQGQDVQLLDFVFQDVEGTGTYLNRLPVSEGGIPGSRKNLRITVDDLRATYQGVRITSPRAVVAANAREPVLRAPLHLQGPAQAISTWLNNRDFFFASGQFVLKTEVDGSLDDMAAMVQESDGKLWLNNVEVLYQPASIRFPFKSLYVAKTGDAAEVKLESKALASGFTFSLDGAINNLQPLLVDGLDSVRVETSVRLNSPRAGWTDFLAYFGAGGYLTSDAPAEPTTGPSDTSNIAALKAVLLGLENRFHPTVDARIDTVQYYDVFTLYDFSTGLHFAGSALELEHTSFRWAGSDLAFGASLELGLPLETPFSVLATTEHLNLNRLRPALNYFGLRLPAGLDSLPDDLNIDFAHQGRIVDAEGIKAGSNAGQLIFDDGSNQLFRGSMDYAPGPAGLRTQLKLTGDPHIVNVLFGAENFFFEGGRFDFDLQLEDTPSDLRDLLKTADLSLAVNDSRVRYGPTEANIPVQAFRVAMEENRADFTLNLRTDTTQRDIFLEGSLDHLTAFLAPASTTENFTVRADARAGTLAWADVRELLGTVSPEGQTTFPDSTRGSRAATTAEGAFRTFRPDLSLRIDTFWAYGATPLVDVHAGLHLRDTTELIWENTGFRYGEGTVAFDGTYALDGENLSPFTINWRMDQLALREIWTEVKGIQQKTAEPQGELDGGLSFSGSLAGHVDEAAQEVLLDDAEGDLHFELHGLQLAGWPALERFGKKALMEKRFEELVIAPFSVRVEVNDGRLVIPRTEIQSTALQLFVEGEYDLEEGPDLLISLPLRNIGRGVLDNPPPPTTYAQAGWKVFLVATPGEEGKMKMKFRLGRRKYHRLRGELELYKALKAQWRAERKAAREGE